MEYLLNLTVIMTPLCIGLLQLMHLNDMYLLFKFTGLHVSQSHTDTHIYMSKWMEYYGMLKF